MCIKHTRFTALNAAASNQHHDDKINTIAMCAFRRGTPNSTSRVNAELVRLYKPLAHRFYLCKQLTKSCKHVNPQRVSCDTWLNRFKPALKAPVKRVVVYRLPVSPMRHLLQEIGRAHV
jgi:hypothetical protein